MYYIIEIQKYQDGTFGHLVHYADTRNRAESKYHEVLAAAAISELPQHSAALISDQGFPILNQCYTHEVINPVVEPEEDNTEENPE